MKARKLQYMDTGRGTANDKVGWRRMCVCGEEYGVGESAGAERRRGVWRMGRWWRRRNYRC